MWERRYQVVAPHRSPGGQRLYSDDDIARLSLLARAAEAGHALPRLARLSRDELRNLVAEAPVLPADGSGPDGALVDRLVGLIERLDADALDRELRRIALAHGAGPFAELIVTPLLRRVGDRWHAGQLTPAHEHLASVVIGRVLGWLTGHFSRDESAPVLVVATPQGEQHELGAAVAAVAAAEAGCRVVYLGANLPATDIAGAARQAGARAVAVSLVNLAAADDLVREVRSLARLLGRRIPVVAGGAAAAGLQATPGVTVCTALSELRKFLVTTPGAATAGTRS
jgi:methylmalonyl-CoA mutase cobalamin-binding subunit/DNA-binding transcriptional MerR regulator